MEFKEVVIKQIDLLFKELNPELLYCLTEEPWDPEFSLEDAWLEVMDLDLEEYTAIRDEICKFGLDYFKKKFFKEICIHESKPC